MISSFVSRGFGYGYNLSEDDLAKVNEYRKNKKYLEEAATMNIHHKIEKDPLTESPFVRWLDYGQNNKGYWNYNHMIVQFEDVCDVLMAIYGHQYEFVFFFDHSSGHDWMRPDGLCANS